MATRSIYTTDRSRRIQLDDSCNHLELARDIQSAERKRLVDEQRHPTMGCDVKVAVATDTGIVRKRKLSGRVKFRLLNAHYQGRMKLDERGEFIFLIT